MALPSSPIDLLCWVDENWSDQHAPIHPIRTLLPHHPPKSLGTTITRFQFEFHLPPHQPPTKLPPCINYKLSNQATLMPMHNYSHPWRKSYMILLVRCFIQVTCTTCTRTMTYDLYYLPSQNICTATFTDPNWRNHWLTLMNTHLLLDETLALLFILLLKNKVIAHE
jgi:hypothetical protein